ncbi:MAG: hypothetical protein IKL65_04170 [Bacilli bacterium]|nr:hypothetical protein [Bacilli bacterium]
MNGNRGAKGSIKDRLISMLYRLRYKKKQLKEENYTVTNKQKQEKYLYNLKNFEEKENIDILEDKDKKELDKVNYKVNFKVQRKKGIGESNETNSIEDLTLKLDSIEYKTDELDEKVDLKKEIRKTKDEITIVKEVDSFIKKSLVNINEIQNEITIIKKESKEKNKDTKKLEERYNILKQKIDKLKLQYETIKDKYDLSEFSIIQSIKLIDTIDDYKSIAKLNEMEMMVKVCKKEISELDSITVIVEESKKIGTDIDNTKQDHNIIKIKFNKSKQKMNEINSLEEELAYEIKYQQEIVDDMYEKASYFEKQISKKIEVVGHRNILGSMLRIAGGILTLPLSGRQLFGIALGSTLINRGLREMNRELETKEKIVVDYKYEDISNQIEQVKDKIEYINLVLSDSLNEIKKLKNNFKNEYSKYNNILPEYNSTLEKLTSLENKLLIQQTKLLNMDKKLDQEKEINKQKLKRIGE